VRSWASGGTGATSKRLAAVPTSTALAMRPSCHSVASAWLVTKAPKEKPASASGPRAPPGAPRPAGPPARRGLHRACRRWRPRHEIETHRGPAALHKGTRQGLHHLVVHGAAEQRWGWAITATPRGPAAPSRLGWSRKASMAPAAPVRVNFSVCTFTYCYSIRSCSRNTARPAG
jgi:hypothetical protein